MRNKRKKRERLVHASFDIEEKVDLQVHQGKKRKKEFCTNLHGRRRQVLGNMQKKNKKIS